MSAKIISGTEIRKKILEEIAVEVKEIKEKHGVVPGLVTILVGENPASISYVTLKIKTANSLGFHEVQDSQSPDISEEDLLALIDKYNNDDSIHGILVQLPLPNHIDEKKVLNAIDPDKDVDGFHPVNVGRLMIGGDEEQVERAKPYLEAMGKSITHVGDQAAGQMVKLVNQILVVVTGLAVSEAMVFAQAGGLDLGRTLQAVEGGAAGSWMLSNRGSQMIVRDWRPGFTIDLQQKDLRLVLEAADQLGIPLLATSIIFQMYRTLQQQGLGGEGNHALIKAIEKMSDITVGG